MRQPPRRGPDLAREGAPLWRVVHSLTQQRTRALRLLRQRRSTALTGVLVPFIRRRNEMSDEDLLLLAERSGAVPDRRIGCDRV